MSRRFLTVEDANSVGIGLLPDLAVARRLGITRQSVAQHRKKLGIPPCARERRRETYSALLSSTHLTYAEAAQAFGYAEGTVRVIAREAGITFRKNARKQRPTRWPDEAVIAALASARSIEVAAISLGMKPPVLSQIIAKRKYRERGIRIPDGRRK